MNFLRLCSVLPFAFVASVATVGSAQNRVEPEFSQPTPRLECKQAGPFDNYGFTNSETGKSIEPWAHKTKAECSEILRLSREVTCIAGFNKRHSLYNVSFAREVDESSTLTFDQCLTVLEASNNRFGLTCSTRFVGEGPYIREVESALYDFRRDVFVERGYSKTFDQCIAALRSSDPFTYQPPVVTPPVVTPPVVTPPVVTPPVVTPPVVVPPVVVPQQPDGYSFYAVSKTVVKAQPVDSAKLSSTKKCSVPAGESVFLENAVEFSPQYWRGTLSGLDSCALTGTTVFLYQPHWRSF
jgi:hypothetical protein